MTRSPSRLPRYKRAQEPPAMLLTARDEQVIAWVHELRFATEEQIHSLVFRTSSHTPSKDRLSKLYHNGYLDRRLIPLRSAYGSSRAVYCLDQRGADLLKLQQKTGAEGVNWRPKDNTREIFFIRHLIASNTVRVSVTLAATRFGRDLVWWDERGLRVRAMRDQLDDPKRPGQRLTVIPDGYFTLSLDGDQQCFALELDRGTVEEKPFKEKVRALGEWKRTGAYRNRFGTDSLRVLFVVDAGERDRHRLSRIKAWTEAEAGRSLFWFASLDEVTLEKVLTEPIWQIAGRDGRHSLLT